MEHPKHTVGFKILDERARQYIPEYKTKLASGIDLHCLEDIVISPGETVLIKTGLAIQPPPGYEIQVRPRSGLSLKTNFVVKNSPGTVDADYQGDLSVIGYNRGTTWASEVITFKAGDRIAQAVLVPVFQMALYEVQEFEQTDRGAAGFGSTGSN